MIMLFHVFFYDFIDRSTVYFHAVENNRNELGKYDWKNEKGGLFALVKKLDLTSYATVTTINLMISFRIKYAT